MSDHLAAIGSFPTAVEAHAARNALAAEGIESYLEGDAAVSNLWHLSVAIGGIRLLVREEDAELAAAFLEQHQQAMAVAGTLPKSAQAEGTWHCAKCGEQVAASFEVCWSCGTTRDGAEDPTFAGVRGETFEEDPEEAAEELERGFAPAIAVEEVVPSDANNPYRASAASDLAARFTEPKLPEEMAEMIDARATVAWRSAVIAALVPLVGMLLSFYSVWVLLELWLGFERLTPFARRRVWATAAVNSISVFWWMAYLRFML